MIPDSLSSAQVRNRAEQARLSTLLQKIEKEKENEMRELNCRRKQFRARYSKLSLPSPYSKKMSEVKMYDILNPGFCYRRNSDQKIICQVQSVPSIAYKQIHELIFTNGEVDIEKILCIHLISAHRSETLTPPRKKNVMCKENSPKERLIDRSKRGYSSYEKLNAVLPLYTIEPVRAGAVGNYTPPPVINDGRLAARLLVNDKIRELLRSVINGLEKSNIEKLNHMSVLAHDEEYIKDVLLDKKNLEFIETLAELPLVTSCESFVLTPPFRIKSTDLFIQTSTGVLERIINKFRHDVLQLPKRNLSITQSMSIEIDKAVKQSPSSRSAPIESFIIRDSMDKGIGTGSSRGSVERDDSSQKRKRVQTNAGPLTILVPKHFVKKAVCPACMAKWRAAPPTPKTPRLRKTDVPTLTNPVFKTNSINRISLLINKEEFMLQSYDRRFSSDNSNKGKINKESIVTEDIENAYIKPMDLARIEQEIREKETEKKLQRFLND